MRDLRDQLIDIEDAARNLSEQIRRLAEIAPAKALAELRAARDRAINCWAEIHAARLTVSQ